ncbi:Hypothetical_protein [Hexamita inflata]|uniref:Hypothetical_protein n=1 Tax=Hexamita inflata TaxID=28002 RepID=A0AA86Q2X5_9EUKA|nr:Hypothetical protein HINF_LOCUS32109 [Hexamita inflata]
MQHLAVQTKVENRHSRRCSHEQYRQNFTIRGERESNHNHVIYFGIRAAKQCFVDQDQNSKRAQSMKNVSIETKKVENETASDSFFDIFSDSVQVKHRHIIQLYVFKYSFTLNCGIFIMMKIRYLKFSLDEGPQLIHCRSISVFQTIFDSLFPHAISTKKTYITQQFYVILINLERLI